MVGVFVSKLVPPAIVLHPPLCAAPSPRGGAQYPVRPKPPWAAGFRVDPALQHCPAGLLPLLGSDPTHEPRSGQGVTPCCSPEGVPESRVTLCSPLAGPRSHQNREEGGPGHH